MCLYVREIAITEGRKLQNIIRRGSNRVKVRRAQVILASAQGSKVPDIARTLYFSPQHIRTIIKDFNGNGFKALEPRYSGGRPPKFNDEQKSLIIETALCPPNLLGVPFTRWSLAKLRDFIIEEKIVDSISIETIRQLLRSNKVKLRRTKTWKECNDPKLRSKKN
jgi:transposase